jgi:hypothetical protein
MKKLSIVFLAAVSLASFAGCKKKGGMIAKLTELKEKACACKPDDKDCAPKVANELEAFAEANKDAKPSAEEEKQAKEVTDQLLACLGAKKKDEPAAAPVTGGAAPAEGSAAPAEGSAAAPAAGSAAAPK